MTNIFYKTAVINPLRMDLDNLPIDCNEALQVVLGSLCFDPKASVLVYSSLEQLEKDQEILKDFGFKYNISYKSMTEVVELIDQKTNQPTYVQLERFFIHGSRSKTSKSYDKFMKKMYRFPPQSASQMYQYIEDSFQAPFLHTMADIHLHGWDNVNNLFSDVIKDKNKCHI